VKYNGKMEKNTLELLLLVREMDKGPTTSQMVGNGQVNGVKIIRMVLAVINFQVE
jgi:hypothetical protein